MGLLSQIKHLGPLAVYIVGIFFFILGLIGKGRWTLLLITFVIPLRNLIDKVQTFPAGNQFIDILILGTFVSWLISSMSGTREFFAKSTLNKVIFVLIFYTFISLILGSNYLYNTFSISLSDERLKEWKNFCLMPLLFFISLNLIKNRKWIIYILIAMIASIILMEYYTILQVYTYPALESREKITGTFQFLGPNEVAAFFNEYTIIMLGIFLSIKVKRVRWVLLALICANIFCIVFLYSRGAYIGIFAGMFFLFFIKNKKMLFPLLIVMIFWQTFLPEKAVERVKGTHNEYGQLDESSQRRVVIWSQALDLFAQNPITGIGFNVFGYLGLDLGDTHNIYVKFLVEQGIIGLVIFLSVIYCFFRMGFVLYKKGEDDDLAKGMGLGLMACIIVVMINNFFGNRWMYFELSAYLWIFTGLVGRLIILDQDAQPTITTLNNEVKSTPITTKEQKKKIRYYDL